MLQGVLNSIDGCLVRGENFQFCQGLFQSYNALMRAQREYGGAGSSGDPTRPWFGASGFNGPRFLDDARTLVLNQLNPEGADFQCVGFKEIRYLHTDREPAHPATDKRLQEYLRFLVQLFRDPAVVLLRRNHEEVLRSGWWSKMEPWQVRRRLEEFEKSCAAFAAEYPGAFHIEYSDVVDRSDRLRELFSFLGAEYDDAQIAAVLAKEHSWRTRAEPNRPGVKARPAHVSP